MYVSWAAAIVSFMGFAEGTHMHEKSFFYLYGCWILTVAECLKHLREGEAAEWTDHQQYGKEQHRQRQRLRS